MPEQPSEAFKRVQPEEVSQSIDPELAAMREKMRKDTEEKLAALRERETPVLEHCPHPTATKDLTTGECRCIVCSRCGNHTGNTNQGHYWGWCTVTKKKEKHHFCCPGDCQLYYPDGSRKTVQLQFDTTIYRVDTHANLVVCKACDSPVFNWTDVPNMTVVQILEVTRRHHKENHA